jgi:starch synthase
MPSRFEPCGQGQMIAMRYGTPPVARRTGGLADTIVDLHEEPDTGTGFLFDDATPDALRFACERAIAVLRDRDRTRWEGLVHRGMAVDWDWERSSAPAYAAMFRRAVAARQAAWAGPGASPQPAAVSQAAPRPAPAVSPATPPSPRPRRP